MNTLTIAIVNFNSKDFLAGCLESIYRETRETPFQVVVVDNASEDTDFTGLIRRYPETVFLQNEQNLGFSTACNQAMRARGAEFYLLLNPDVEILDAAVDRTLRFLREKPETGIVGCRVENSDGSLQLACRRTIPRPSVALYRILGLSRLFPRSRRFARYNLSYLDDRESHDVEAVSGSFLMLRHGVLVDTGGLDESFFLYGEDLDLCYRALQEGWKVRYFAGARVLHHKRRSSSTRVAASTRHYYQAMEIFHRKHFSGSYGFFSNALIVGGIRGLYRLTRLRQTLFGHSEVGSGL